MTPEEINGRLLHRDGLMLVLDKPAGIAVHAGPKGGPCLEDYFDALRFGLPRNPGLAHRLDRDTSGCLILGRHRKALESLGKMFRQGRISKTYWAVVEDGPEEDEGLIDMALGRLDATRGWWQQPDPLGQPAQTRWRVMGRGVSEGRGKLALVALQPLTGRTHQLRVHTSSLGWPILGDPIYGNGKRPGSPRLQLHARDVTVPLSAKADPIRVEAPPPPHMRESMARCGFADELLPA